MHYVPSFVVLYWNGKQNGPNRVFFFGFETINITEELSFLRSAWAPKLRQAVVLGFCSPFLLVQERNYTTFLWPGCFCVHYRAYGWIDVLAAVCTVNILCGWNPTVVRLRALSKQRVETFTFAPHAVYLPCISARLMASRSSLTMVHGFI